MGFNFAMGIDVGNVNKIGVLGSIFFFLTIALSGVVGFIAVFLFVTYLWGGEELLSYAIADKSNDDIKNIVKVSLFFGPLIGVSGGAVVFVYLYKKLIKKFK